MDGMMGGWACKWEAEPRGQTQRGEEEREERGAVHLPIYLRQQCSVQRCGKAGGQVGIQYLTLERIVRWCCGAPVDPAPSPRG